MKDHQRVLVVDDHPVVLRGLRAMLEGESWVDEVFEATTAADAVKEAVTRRVHLVVMDVRFPDGDGDGDGDGIDATVRILRALPSVVVLIMTMDGDQDIVARAMAAGAHGFVLKDLDPDDLMSSLRAVASGSVVIGPNVDYFMINDG